MTKRTMRTKATIDEISVITLHDLRSVRAVSSREIVVRNRQKYFKKSLTNCRRLYVFVASCHNQT